MMTHVIASPRSQSMRTSRLPAGAQNRRVSTVVMSASPMPD
jgi:hypothetical protein